jgi:hypothetical protein
MRELAQGKLDMERQSNNMATVIWLFVLLVVKECVRVVLLHRFEST